MIGLVMRLDLKQPAFMELEELEMKRKQVLGKMNPCVVPTSASPSHNFLPELSSQS